MPEDPSCPFYQVDAFTDRPFAGNPAAVCDLDAWPDDALLAEIAAENNLSETAFIVPTTEHGDAAYRIRWFTPAAEVDLCGHATLAAGHVAYAVLGAGAVPLVFASNSGPLGVTPKGNARYQLDFPAVPTELLSDDCSVPDSLAARMTDALGRPPLSVHQAGDDLLVRYPDAAAILLLTPDFAALERLSNRGIMATAPGETTDFCSRFFAPAVGVPEDPVTGSAHCALGPYWAAELGKTKLTATQLSTRGGALTVTVSGERVLLDGACVTTITGTFHLPL